MLNNKQLLDIKKQAEKGIRVDTQKLKKDSCAQFRDYNEWLREYVNNAYDAGATECLIHGQKDGDIVSVFVRDNGRGMNRQRVLDFFTLYRSRKDGDPSQTIGRHGIGKISVAAIPDQCGFKMITSDGSEAWQTETGSLLDDANITLQRVEPVPESGTTFCIQFITKKSLAKVMKELEQVLYTYVRYLKMEIRIFLPDESEKQSSGTWRYIAADWELDNASIFKSYVIDLNGNFYEIVLSIGKAEHGIYQNRVFITNNYNLLSHDLGQAWFIPGLCIRVDSPDFELPFGRHCLCNEEILGPLSKVIRTKLLPDFLLQLKPYFERSDAGQGVEDIEEMVVGLCFYHPDYTQLWTHWPVYRLVDGIRASLKELRKQVSANGKIYIASEDEVGADYSFFDGPVVSSDQIGNGLQVIEQVFGAATINLRQQDLVMETPGGSKPNLSDLEKRFARALGFHPRVFDLEPKDDNTETGRSFMNEPRLQGLIKEQSKAKQDLESINWRVSHLVERDGKTPCLRHRYLYKDDEVVLNLYHPDIKKLVKLAEHQPSLAGHWAIAMCLTEDSHILSHLSAESREDILLLDAMSKLSEGSRSEGPERKEKTNANREMWNFIRNAMDRHSLTNKR
ncbi:ATP-binding protein [candidate division KSB1 bacterium]|nr:ATP-binding protein [candidate division KSB1 bacterium]